MRTIRWIWAVAAVVMCSTAVHAQPAPNRAGEVAQILATIGPVVESPTDDARRAALYTIAQRLDAAGDRFWGVLVKTDQGNKIPADILVWRPTMEHFDIMTGGTVSPTWIPKGQILNSAWIWQAPDAAAPETSGQPATPPSGPPAQAVNLQPVLDKIVSAEGELLQRIAEAESEATKRTDAIDQKIDTLGSSILTAVDSPGWLSRFFSNRAVQAGLAVVGSILITRQMVKPATVTAVTP